MGPVGLHTYTNWSCNLACGFCFTRDRRRSERVPDMTPKLLEHVLETFPSLQNAWVGAPGESLMLDALPALLRVLGLYDLRVHITTNGTKVRERADIPWELVDSVTVSIVDPLPEQYQKATGTKLFDEACEGVSKLVDLVPVVKIASLVTRDSVNRIPAFLELAADLGARGAILRERSWVEGETTAAFRSGHALHAGIPGLADRIQAMKEDAPSRLDICWPHVLDFDRPKAVTCSAPSRLLAVNGAGEVACCCRGPGPRAELGNVRQGAEVWSTGPMAELKERILGPEPLRPDKCRCCYAAYEVAP